MRAAAAGAVRFATISDGCDAGDFGESDGVTSYLTRLESSGSDTLSDLLATEAAVRVVVYDAFLPWARGAAAVAFFTQPCAVNVVYGHVWRCLVKSPVEAGAVELPGLPALEPEGLPWFLKVGPGPYPAYFDMVMRQFDGLELADDVLVNSFYELDRTRGGGVHGVGMASQDDRPDGAGGLPRRRPHSGRHQVRLPHVRAHHGAVHGMARRPPSPLRRVRLLRQPLQPRPGRDGGGRACPPHRHHAFPLGRASARPSPTSSPPVCRHRGRSRWDGGDVVPPSGGASPPVSRVHCGWNSTAEALVAGVPMVVLPQWTDQLMNAKYVEDVWRVGVRVRPAAAEVIAARGDVVAGIEEVMRGERSGEYRRNAAEWMEKARKASKEGGSSDRNIAEFVAKYTAK